MKKWILALAVIAFTIPELFAQTNLPLVRVALVSSCGGDAAGNELALATVALSKESGIILIERTEVERILQEQHLERCGMSDSRQALAVGRLLNAEVFAAVESYGSSNATLGFIVFDAKNGVRLWDAALPGGNPKLAAEKIAAAVRESCLKRNNLGARARTVCLLAVRNLGLPREMDSACDALGRLLERRLLGSPNLAILERQRLEQINRERELPGSAASGILQSSLVLLELEIARTENHTLIGTVFLTDGAGKILNQVKASLATLSPGDLAEALLPGLLEALNAASPSTNRDLASEAQRFLGESQFLYNDGDRAGALRMAEAALALDAGSANIQLQLAQCLAQQAVESIQQGNDVKGSLPVAERALQICRQLRLKAQPLDLQLRPIEETLAAANEWKNRAGYWAHALDIFEKQDRETKNQLLDFQTRLREAAQLHLEFWRAQVTNYYSGSVYADVLEDALPDAEYLSSSSGIWTAEIERMISGALEVFEKFPVPRGGWAQPCARSFARLCCQANGCAQQGRRVGEWELNPNDLGRLGKLFEKMEKHSDPVIQSYGRIGQFALGLRGQKQLTENTRGQFQKIKEFVLEKIATPGKEPEANYRRLLYDAARDLIDIVPDASFRRQEHLALFEFMMQRRELAFWTAYMVIDPAACRFGQHHYWPEPFPMDAVGYVPGEFPALLANSQRVLALFNSTNRTDVDATSMSFRRGSFDQELAEMCKRIYAQRPDLATNTLTNVPWAKAQTFFTVSPSSKQSRIRNVVANGTDAFAAIANWNYGKPSAEIVRIPLDGKSSATISVVPMPNFGYLDPIEMVVDEGVLYVGERNKAVHVLPINGGPGRKINQATGLLSDHIGAFTIASGKLYVMLNEGHLVAYDLHSSRCEMLASKRSKEKHSPLDEVSTGFNIGSMLHDALRHRVLFTTEFNEKRNCFPLIGLWQIDTATGAIKQLLELFYPARWMRLNDSDHVLLCCPRNENDASCQPAFCSLVSYDLRTNSARLLWTYNDPVIRPAGPTLPGEVAIIRRQIGANSPFLVQGDWLWFICDGHRRLSLKNGALEEFPPPEKTQNSGRAGWHTLQRLDNGQQILAADDTHVWLLTLEKN